MAAAVAGEGKDRSKGKDRREKQPEGEKTVELAKRNGRAQARLSQGYYLTLELSADPFRRWKKKKATEEKGPCGTVNGHHPNDRNTSTTWVDSHLHMQGMNGARWTTGDRLTGG